MYAIKCIRDSVENPDALSSYRRDVLTISGVSRKSLPWQPCLVTEIGF